MDHSNPLLFVYLLKVGIILLWQNLRFSRTICNHDWLYKAWDFDTAQCGDYTLAYHFTPSFKDLLVKEERIKILFHSLVMKDYSTPSDHQMLESNLKSILTSIWILKTTYHINIAVWFLRIQNIMSKGCCQHITYYTPSFNLFLLVVLLELTWKRYSNHSVEKQQVKDGVTEKMENTFEWNFFMCACSDIE